MAYKPKRISASRSKHTSRRIREATIGTHVKSGGKPSARRQNAGAVDFSNARKSSRAKRGIVDHVIPDTKTRESESAYARRVSQRHYTESIQRRVRVRGIVIALATVLLIACVACGVGAFAYLGSVSDRMGLGDSDVKTALTAPVAGEPYYVLLVGEFSQTGQSYEGPDMLALARVDAQAKQVTLVSIPANLQVKLNDGQAHRISDAQLMGGDSYLVSTVASATDLPVSHIVKTDGRGLVGLVDALGGLDVDVVEEVDDPNAGAIYLPSGQQHLDGEAVLTLCRARNFTDGIETRTENQRRVALALADKLLDSNGITIVPLLDSIADTIKTDLSAGDVMGLADAFRGTDLATAYSVQMPGYEMTSSSTGIEYYVSSDDDWATMSEALEAGQDPTPAEPDTASVDPGSFTVTVLNGTGESGGAQALADVLAEGGFKVTETGNADQYVYTETLVVYKDAAFEPAAEAIVAHLGTGRAIAANGLYTFETDVLVMLGDDWKPLN